MALLGDDLEQNGQVLIQHLTIIDGQRFDEHLARVELSQSFDFRICLLSKEVCILCYQS